MSSSENAAERAARIAAERAARIAAEAERARIAAEKKRKKRQPTFCK